MVVACSIKMLVFTRCRWCLILEDNILHRQSCPLNTCKPVTVLTGSLIRMTSWIAECFSVQCTISFRHGSRESWVYEAAWSNRIICCEEAGALISFRSSWNDFTCWQYNKICTKEADWRSRPLLIDLLFSMKTH